MIDLKLQKKYVNQRILKTLYDKIGIWPSLLLPFTFLFLDTVNKSCYNSTLFRNNALDQYLDEAGLSQMRWNPRNRSTHLPFIAKGEEEKKFWTYAGGKKNLRRPEFWIPRKATFQSIFIVNTD